MKFVYLLLAAVLLFGCVEPREEVNETNITVQNETPPVVVDKNWDRYNASGFSFEYPSNMAVQFSQGIFAGDHQIKGETGEMLIIIYYNTEKVYGENRNKVFKENPEVAVSELLAEDHESDPAQILDQVETFGEVSTYSISRDTYISEAPITLRFSNSETKFHGYGISMFSPDRSLHLKVRVIAKDQAKADSIRERFFSSFWIE
jgi:hypothetical protein